MVIWALKSWLFGYLHLLWTWISTFGQNRAEFHKIEGLPPNLRGFESKTTRNLVMVILAFFYWLNRVKNIG